MLNKNNLMIMKICPARGGKFPLDTVRVTPEYTEATDSYAAIRVSLPIGVGEENFPAPEGFAPTREFEPFLLAREHAAQMLKWLGGKKSPQPILNHIAFERRGQEPVIFVCAKDFPTRQVLQASPVGGGFPSLDGVLRGLGKEKLRTELEINVERLGQVLRLVGEMLDARSPRVRIAIYREERGPLLMVRALNQETGQEIVAAVMGMASVREMASDADADEEAGAGDAEAGDEEASGAASGEERGEWEKGEENL
jgi:hypothetical protein